MSSLDDAQVRELESLRREVSVLKESCDRFMSLASDAQAEALLSKRRLDSAVAVIAALNCDVDCELLDEIHKAAVERMAQSLEKLVLPNASYDVQDGWTDATYSGPITYTSSGSISDYNSKYFSYKNLKLTFDLQSETDHESMPKLDEN